MRPSANAWTYVCVCVCVCVCVRADAQPTSVERRACARGRARVRACVRACVRAIVCATNAVNASKVRAWPLFALWRAVGGQGGGFTPLYTTNFPLFKWLPVLSQLRSRRLHDRRALAQLRGGSSTLRASTPRSPCCYEPARTRARLCVRGTVQRRHGRGQSTGNATLAGRVPPRASPLHRHSSRSS